VDASSDEQVHLILGPELGLEAEQGVSILVHGEGSVLLDVEGFSHGINLGNNFILVRSLDGLSVSPLLLLLLSPRLASSSDGVEGSAFRCVGIDHIY